jgi:hypothetical protein
MRERERRIVRESNMMNFIETTETDAHNQCPGALSSCRVQMQLPAEAAVAGAA